MSSFAEFVHRKHDRGAPGGTHGWVLDWGAPYDLVSWLADKLLFRGKLAEVRQQTLDLAGVKPGDAVLDVGCGTGTLALVAKERVGASGRVVGIDPAPRQIARARSKATRRGTAIELQTGVIERLELDDRSFDAVLSTMMMHHLPDDLKRRGLAEIARVLKPGGRLAIVDFKRREPEPGKPARLGAGAIGVQDLPALLTDAGFTEVERGDVPLRRLPGFAGVGFVRGRRAAP